MQPPPRPRAGRCLGGVFLLLAFAGGASPGAGATAEPRLEILGEAPGSGEQCLVCRQAIHGAKVLEVRYKGRVFHVKAEMLDELEADPDAYFRALESHAALFDEDALAAGRERPERRRGWFYLGLYVLAGLSAGALCAALAVRRDHPPLPWFAAGLVANVLALAALATRGRGAASGPQGVPAGLAKVPVTRAPRPCRHCGEPVHPAARVCGACSGALEPEVEPETACLEGWGG